VATRAERDEVAKVGGCAAVRDRPTERFEPLPDRGHLGLEPFELVIGRDGIPLG